MTSLNDTLTDFAHAIVRAKPASSQIDTHYQNYTADIAVEVYRNNYRGNLHDALAGAYPVIEQLVGKDFFQRLTQNYIWQHLSCSGNLHHYGAEMASVIAAFEPAKGLPYLADVATLEWACHCAYFANDAAELDLVRLAQIPAEQYSELILQLHPACHLLCSRYPTAAIWLAHQAGADSDFYIDLDSGSCNALVSRKDDVVKVAQLSAADSVWLLAIQAGAPLGEATEAAQAQFADFDLQAALLNIVAQDVLSDFSIRNA